MNAATEKAGAAGGLRVLKFGGTSVQDATRIGAVVQIVAQRIDERPLVVVVSALGGVTNSLLAAVAAAAERSPGYREIFDQIVARHVEALEALVPEGDRGPIREAIDSATADLSDLLHGVSLLSECPPRTLDRVLSYGELLSSRLVAAAFRTAGVAAEACDARRIIVTDSDFGNARVVADATRARIREHFQQAEALQVVTGFLGSTVKGETTTLGRGGSDYTAALVGAALAAEAVEIWTDVDGVMSADPRVVPDAFSLPLLSYTELLELSHFGAKVVYPPTVHPARAGSIPLVVRNTLNPSFPGTWVVADVPDRKGHLVRGISSIPRVALLRLEGDWMVGTPELAERLFGSLAREGISVILVTQASSGHSICFAIDPAQLERAKARIEEEFKLDRRAGLMDDIVVETECSVIAAVGEGMRETPGLAGRLFSVLGSHGINVRAIAQGSSEFNISLVVSAADHGVALRAIHDAFFRRGARSVRIYVVGLGRVGSTLVDQIGGAAESLKPRMGLHLKLAGLATSGTLALAEGANGLDSSCWRAALKESERPLAVLVDAAIAARNGPRVFVDCTASSAVAAHYERLLKAGVAVVSANKLPFSGASDCYRALKDAAVEGGGLHLETTVGAGLPILDPLAHLLLTGDRIRGIEGVLSGTLSYVLTGVMEGAQFSQVLRAAHEKGFTEPDPREDLSGNDVARKLVILAREAGLQVEPDEVEVEPLIPKHRWDRLSTLSMDAFWEALPTLDEEFRARREEAVRRGRRLCYLARIGEGRPRVGVVELEPDHPCAALRGTDNLVAVTSDRYDTTPMVVRGPGAGPQVTASGVFAGILRAAQESRW